MGTTFIVGAGGGITKLSQLIIDADKPWQTKGISNIKELALGMTTGDILVFNGIRLVKLSPAAMGLVLTSQGPLNMPIWAPGGTYFDRFLPVEFMLTHSEIAPWTPNASKSVPASLTSPYGINDDMAPIHPEWFETQEPAFTSTKAAALLVPDHTDSEAAPLTTSYDLNSPVDGAVKDVLGVQTTQTTEAKSGYTLYESYLAGEDGQNAIDSTNWVAQTFTPGTSHAIRFIWLKLFSAAATNITVSIKAVDGAFHPTGADLCAVTLVPPVVATPGRMVKCTFAAPAQLTAGTQYAIVVRTDGTGNVSWRKDSAGAAYAGGNLETSANAGASWAATAGADLIFEEWGTPVADMDLFAVVITANDAYYFGWLKKFGNLFVDINPAGAGTYTVAWEYSQGAAAWAACVGLTDGSNAFKNAWTQEVSHTPQADWAVDTVNGVAGLYWLRARCTAAGAGYSQPKGNFARCQITI